MHDITVFRGGNKEDKKENWDQEALYFKIKQGDRIVGDSGYEGEPSKIVVMRDEHSKEFKKFLTRVSSHQETFFKGLKDWKILRERFCLWKHHSRNDEIAQDGCRSHCCNPPI